MESLLSKESAAAALVQVLPVMDNTLTFIKRTIKNNSMEQDLDEAFLVGDVGELVIKHRRWLKEFPRIAPYYAVKCNPDSVMLKTLIALGTGFDCASKAEICQMLTLGAKPDQIIFANPCKQSSHIRYARDNNVKLLVFDNEEELFKIKKDFPDAKLLLRIETDDETSMFSLSTKFGAKINASQSLLDLASQMGFEVVGVCFHVGSECQDATAYVKALENARSLFDYAETVGYHFNLLDIGGGFPGSENRKIKVEEIAFAVNKQLDTLFPESDFCDLRVVAEPGTYYAESMFTVATCVIGKKKIVEDRKKGLNEKQQSHSSLNPQPLDITKDISFMYYLNEGAFGTFNFALYLPDKVSPTLLKLSSSLKKYPSIIWGPTCDSTDKIMGNVLLPELNISDWIAWHNVGAYGTSCSSGFNGFKVTKIYYVISAKNLDLLRNMVKDQQFIDAKFAEELHDNIVKNILVSKDFDEAFLVGDVGELVIKHRRWLKEFPGIAAYYAAKCNPDSMLLKTLIALGIGFDCSSKAEICQTLTLGAKPDQIIYASLCKQSSHVRYARDNDVNLLVFDNEEKLLKIKKDFPDAKLVLVYTNLNLFVQHSSKEALNHEEVYILENSELMQAKAGLVENLIKNHSSTSEKSLNVFIRIKYDSMFFHQSSGDHEVTTFQ